MFQEQGKIEIFSDLKSKTKLRYFTTKRPTLKELLKS